MIKIITCPAGDWKVVKFNETVVSEGHDIGPYEFVDVLRQLGHEVEEVEISDSDMEEGNY